MGKYIDDRIRRLKETKDEQGGRLPIHSDKELLKAFEALQKAEGKIKSALVAHPNAVRYLLEEALAAIDALGK